ncbi:MAG: biopolymer transporter ExbD, partial [marine benthic group bacterium]|nr:biopolymer transporter ExbD [Candidatus Benthicola marisminoris]
MIGGRLGGGPENGLPVRAEINVTSLVDVAFTLLVIFMITAPILQGGVEVAVPKAPSAPLQVSEGLVITVDRDGQIYVDDDVFTRDEFAATIVQMVERRGGPTVYV